MFIEAMCRGETKSRSRRSFKRSAPSARSSFISISCVVELDVEKVNNTSFLYFSRILHVSLNFCSRGILVLSKSLCTCATSAQPVVECTAPSTKRLRHHIMVNKPLQLIFRGMYNVFSLVVCTLSLGPMLHSTLVVNSLLYNFF